MQTVLNTLSEGLENYQEPKTLAYNIAEKWKKPTGSSCA
jgi:hypothetical protein